MKDIGDYVDKTFVNEKDWEKLEDWAVAKAKQEEENKKKEAEKKAQEELATNVSTSIASAIEQGTTFDIPVFSEDDKLWFSGEKKEKEIFTTDKLYPYIQESVKTVLENIEGIDFTNKETYVNIAKALGNNEEQAQQFADMLGVTVEQLSEALKRAGV
jgi:transcriptional regulator with GAF, ATPase, and Fis domain